MSSSRDNCPFHSLGLLIITNYTIIYPQTPVLIPFYKAVQSGDEYDLQGSYKQLPLPRRAAARSVVPADVNRKP